MDCTPEKYLANMLSWQFFATLTFARVPSDAVRQKMLHAWLRWFDSLGQRYATGEAATGSRPFGSFWMAREELGEIGGRVHFHVLLAGLPQKLVNVRTCMASCAAWERLGGGMARNYVYSSDLDGVEYVLKGLSEAQKGDSSRYAALQYELGKFTGEEGRRVLLGHSLIWKLMTRKSNKRLVTARAMRALRRGN